MAKKKAQKATKRKVSKKKAAKTKPAKKLSWHEQTIDLAEKIAKRAPGSKAGLMVLSRNGDLIVKAGKFSDTDWTAVGALFSSMLAAAEQLSKIFNTNTGGCDFGESGKGFWAEQVGDWLVIGLRMKRSTALNAFFKHLKKNKLSKDYSSQSKRQSEALDGLSDAAVEAAFES